MEFEFQHSFYLCSVSVGPLSHQTWTNVLWFIGFLGHYLLLCYVATDLALLHTWAATPVFSKHLWCIPWNKHFGGQEENLSLVSKFPWQFSLKITRKVLFCQLSGNWMEDSLSFIPCSKENTALKMFEHWCTLIQLWEKGRFFFHVCTSGQENFTKDMKTVIITQQLCDAEWMLQLLSCFLSMETKVTLHMLLLTDKTVFVWNSNLFFP